MKPEVKQNIVILTSIALIAGFFFPIQFVHENMAAGICRYDNVQSGVNFESWGFNTRCVHGPPNEDLFELAPGITLGLISFTVSFLALSKLSKSEKFTPIYQIGFLSGIAYSFDQIFEAIMRNQFGWMYNHMGHTFPVLHIIIMCLLAYLVGQYALDRKILKYEIGSNVSKKVIIFGSTFTIFVASYYFMSPHDPTMLFFLIGLFVNIIIDRIGSRKHSVQIIIHEYSYAKNHVYSFSK